MTTESYSTQESDLTRRAREVLAGLSSAAPKMAIEYACNPGKHAQRRYWRYTSVTTAIELYRAGAIDENGEPTEIGREVVRLMATSR